MDYQWDFAAVFRQSDLLLEGAAGTLGLAGTAIVVAVPLGLLLAVLRMSAWRPASLLATGYIEFFRSSAALVLIFWFYFAFPMLVGIDMTPYAAATLAISLQSSAYFAEVFRGGIGSIHRGQWEAAKALGMNYRNAMRFVILPQAVKRMLPVFFTRVIELLKTTALAAAIAYGDLVYSASRVISITFRPLETFTVVALIFFFTIFAMSVSVRWMERRLAASD